jgi:hypothetical protein
MNHRPSAGGKPGTEPATPAGESSSGSTTCLIDGRPGLPYPECAAEGKRCGPQGWQGGAASRIMQGVVRSATSQRPHRPRQVCDGARET